MDDACYLFVYLKIKSYILLLMCFILLNSNRSILFKNAAYELLNC